MTFIAIWLVLTFSILLLLIKPESEFNFHTPWSDYGYAVLTAMFAAFVIMIGASVFIAISPIIVIGCVIYWIYYRFNKN